MGCGVPFPGSVSWGSRVGNECGLSVVRKKWSSYGPFPIGSGHWPKGISVHSSMGTQLKDYYNSAPLLLVVGVYI